MLATLIVAAAIALMIALGIWQLRRLHEKEAALARYAANVTAPAVAFPLNGTGDSALFRRSAVDCRAVTGRQRESGRNAAGAAGWRQIVHCTTGAGGAEVLVQLGVARRADAPIAFAGGRVAGWISHAPDHRALLSGLWDHTPKRLMLVAAAPAAGLEANPGPDLSAVPNNHLAYAVQWFLFAGIALIIYVLALGRRMRS